MERAEQMNRGVWLDKQTKCESFFFAQTTEKSVINSFRFVIGLVCMYSRILFVFVLNWIGKKKRECHIAKTDKFKSNVHSNKNTFSMVSYCDVTVAV